MDLQNQFKDLNIDDNIEKDAEAISKKAEADESAKVIRDLEKRLAEIKTTDKQNQKSTIDDLEEGDEDEEDDDDEYEPTLLEKVQPFIWPIMLTLFAIIFAGLFLYFFSKSRIQSSQTAIVNVGAVDPTYYPPQEPDVKVVEEPLKCTLPQYLNEEGDECLDPEPVEEEPEPEPEPEVEKVPFGNPATVRVRFSFDKYNYDNAPRGIFVLADQEFSGDYENFKIAPTNRAFANDHFFGVDRYMVSLIGSCSYVVDDAKILVKDMTEKDRYFTGNVVKVLEASKPRIDCTK